VFAVAGLVAVLGGLATAPVHLPGGRVTAATLSAASCPAATHPGSGSTQPYQLSFTGSLSAALRITSTPAGPVNLPTVTGTFCGLLELPLERAVVQPQNLHLSPPQVQVKIARATVPASIATSGQSAGTVNPTPAPNGGLNLTLAVPVAATTGLFGVSCQVPVDLDLSTTNPGGSPLVGPLTHATATVAQSGFTIQPAVSTGASGTCPYYLASQVDQLLGLPNTSTTSTVGLTLDVTIP
jgi:hypothetical protein